MHLFKKTALFLAAFFALSFPLSACEATVNPSESSSFIESADSESENENSSTDEESSYSEDSSSQEEYDEELLAMQQTVDLAYDLSYGEKMEGSYTLTGRVTSIESGKKFTAFIVVQGREDFPIQCYNISGEVDAIKVGDIITVWGSMENYKGTVEFNSPLLLTHSPQTPPAVGNDPYVKEIFLPLICNNHTDFLAFRMVSAVCCGVWLELSSQKPIRGVVCILYHIFLILSMDCV